MRSVDLFREPTYIERIESAAAFAVYGAAYLGAAFGPLLLPFSVYQAFRLTRAVGASSRVIWAWTFVALGLVATALFWGWLTTLDIFCLSQPLPTSSVKRSAGERAIEVGLLHACAPFQHHPCL